MVLRKLKRRIKNHKENMLSWLNTPAVTNSTVPSDPREFYLGANTIIDTCKLDIYNKIGANCYLYKCEVGKYTYMADHVAMMNTKIGNFCSIAAGVGVSLGKHPTTQFVSTHPAFFSLNRQCGTTFADEQHFEEMVNTSIGNDVWIGYNAIILDGLEIGDGAIIGAGAVVTKNVPPYAIVAGNPARIIKYRFKEDEIDFLLRYKWWEKDPVWIRKNHKLFHDIKLLMEQQ